MILDCLQHHRRYHALLPQFQRAFEYLERLPSDIAVGRYEIDGDKIVALTQSYNTTPLNAARFEAHQHHIDIQYIQAGQETMLWSPLSHLTEITRPYIPERDITLYATPSQWTAATIRAGQFTIFFPEDGHAPGLHQGTSSEVRKTVIKLRN